MGLNVILLLLVLCAVIFKIECGRPCDYFKNMAENTRVKRAKYYSSPQRIFRRPPIPYPTAGVYSFTPPPSMVDEEDTYPRNFRPSRFTSNPTPETLGDEDINNFVKYLSKQDLDKIVEATNYKDKYNKNEPYESKLSAYKYDNMYKHIQGIDQHFETNSPQIRNITQNPYDIEFNKPVNIRDMSPRIVNSNTQVNQVDFGNTLLDTEESMRNKHVSFFNYHMEEDENVKHTTGSRDADSTDTTVEPEELLPRPVNLRDDQDFDGSFTNNIPSVIKADSSYKVESFRDLPLMNYYNKHQHTISSYQAPHYTVTTFPKRPSSQKPSSSSSSSSANTPPIEPAPPVSEAREQSDAHLKATRIWTHKSKGTAYYLHPDGTLSLEIPKRWRPYSHLYT